MTWQPSRQPMWASKHFAMAFLDILLKLSAVLLFPILFLAASAFYNLPPRQPRKAPPTCPHILIVLGSGGHTGEMLRMVGAMPQFINKFPKRTYVFNTGDSLSAKLAANMEAELKDAVGLKVEDGGVADLIAIPRSREIGQSLATTPLSALKTLLTCLRIIMERKPDLILLNGPGNAFIMALACVLLRICSFGHVGQARIVFVESFARVRTLSLSGKLCYYIVDRCIVQWEGIKENWKGVEYRGILV